jgi:peptidoglycan/xylan/chitin deacetylase (PgdA/CDA1 family)
MIAEGHEIGNHTHSLAARPLPQRLFWPVPATQVTRAQEAVRAVTGATPRYFRSPGGQMGRPLWRAVRRQGLQIVNGALPMPPPEGTAAAQLATVRRTLRDGSIIILHDGDDRRPDSARPRTTVALLPPLFAALRERGYDVVPLARLIGNGTA